MESQNQELKEKREAQYEIDDTKLEQYLEELKLKQNLPLAVFGAALGSLVGAISWAALTVLTNLHIGFMAVLVGFLVGFIVRKSGKGIDRVFAYIGAAFAFIGCLLGNFLSLIAYFANDEGLGYFEVLKRIDYRLVPGLMVETSSVIVLVFYGIAIYEGYKFSLRKISEKEIIRYASKEVNAEELTDKTASA